MELTTYQKQILNYFRDYPSNNLYVNAKAGCGKSFIAAQMLKDVENNSVYLAFNKSIAEEMKAKISNPKVNVYTMHGLCNSILNYNLHNERENSTNAKRAIGINRGIFSEGQLDHYKIYKIIDNLLYKDSEARRNFEYKTFLKENYVKLYNLIRLKVINLDDAAHAKKNLALTIMEQNLFFHDKFETPSIEEVLPFCKQIHNKSLELFNENKVYDFTDMLYITYIKLCEGEWSVPYWHMYSNVVNDELQDYSTIQLYLLRFFKRKNGRFVFILDPNQAIYLFSGANSSSFKLVKTLYAPVKEFQLPINYRCATSHLEYVNRLHNIGIKPCPTASVGTIERINKDTALNLIEPGDYLIGRKNKWLLPMILELIKRGKPVYIKDEAFVKSIKKVIEDFNFNSIIELERKIKNKEQQLRQKLEEKKKKEREAQKELEIQDELEDNELEEMQEQDITVEEEVEDNSGQTEVLEVIKRLLYSFKEQYTTNSKNQFLKYIDSILNTTKSENCIFVSSIHCVKGLEAENVFVLNEGKPVIDNLMSREQRQQEYNLSYVALTRAKENLYLVKAEGEEYGKSKH